MEKKEEKKPQPRTKKTPPFTKNMPFDPIWVSSVLKKGIDWEQ